MTKYQASSIMSIVNWHLIEKNYNINMPLERWNLDSFWNIISSLFDEGIAVEIDGTRWRYAFFLPAKYLPADQTSDEYIKSEKLK